jgi:hypothetical protein
LNLSAKQVDYLNIGLMILSFLLAVKLPFQVFLMSYAILGPLHYLTEIGWLDQRSYFSKNKSDAWILVALCAMVTLAFGFIESNHFELGRKFLKSIEGTFVEDIAKFLRVWEKSFIFLAFAAGLLMVLVKNRWWRYSMILVAGIVAYFLHDQPPYIMIIGVMLPTIIHVFVFTGAFILFGALKSGSTSGYLSLLVFILILWVIPNINIEVAEYKINDYWLKTMEQSNFHLITYHIADFMGWSKGQYYVFSEIGIKMQIFFAYAYTYHYLNWFSKTKIINWHKVPKKYLIASVGIWILAVALYFYNYKIGLMALFFLSVLHVFLEFPLNHLTFIGIFKELKARFRSKPKSS